MLGNNNLVRIAVIPALIFMALSIGNTGEKKANLVIEESSLEVTFIANEGVMISSHGKKVLIDALFDKPNPEYDAPPKDMLESMTAGKAPFDNVDLVLVTHIHPDHFSPSVGAQFMKNNLNAVLIGADDAVSAMKDLIKDWGAVKDRMLSFNLKPGETSEKTVKGIAIKIFRTLHSGDRESPHNFMYLIKMNGKTIFHEGDSDGKVATFKELGLENEKIDLALVHFWFPLHPEGEKIIQGILKPDHVGLIHLPKRLKSDAPVKIDMVKSNYKDIFLFLKPGEKKIFH